MDLETIGKHIREKRKARGLVQEELAEKVGLSKNYIGMIERGKRLPSLDTFIIILNELDVSADEILVDVVNQSHETNFKLRLNRYTEDIDKLSVHDKDMLLQIIDIMRKSSK